MPASGPRAPRAAYAAPARSARPSGREAPPYWSPRREMRLRSSPVPRSSLPLLLAGPAVAVLRARSRTLTIHGRTGRSQVQYHVAAAGRLVPASCYAVGARPKPRWSRKQTQRSTGGRSTSYLSRHATGSVMGVHANHARDNPEKERPMALFVVRHQHPAERCPARDPQMGAMLLNHLSDEHARQEGMQIQGEAVIDGQHTLYMILEAEDQQ